MNQEIIGLSFVSDHSNALNSCMNLSHSTRSNALAPKNLDLILNLDFRICLVCGGEDGLKRILQSIVVDLKTRDLHSFGL